MNVTLCNDLGYADIKRVETWTGKILDVKRMCLAWLKKDGERAEKNQREKDSGRLKALIALVREILAHSWRGNTEDRPEEEPEE